MQGPDQLATYLNSVQATLAQSGPLLLGGVLIVECLPVIGFAAPGLTILVAAGYYVGSQQSPEPVQWIGAALSGVLAADTLAFGTGRVFASKWPFLKRFADKHKALRVQLASQPWGLLVWYQFPPYSRMFAPLLLGTLSLSWSRWWSVAVPSTLLFVSAFFGLGFGASLTQRALIETVGIASSISLLALGMLAAWAVWFYRRFKRDSAK